MMDDIFTEILCNVRQVMAETKKLGRKMPSVKVSFSAKGWGRCIASRNAFRVLSPVHDPKYVCGYPFSVDVNQSDDFKVITRDGF